MTSLLCILVATCLLFVFVDGQSYVTVNTKSGSIKGERITVNGKDINRFLGIPYAKAPIGRYRFKQTVPVSPWKNVFDALTLPSTCYQVRDDTFGTTFSGSNMWNPNTPMSEDCLKLNIWAPAERKNLSTLVWIFGGSFNAGTSTLDLYDPSYLVAENDVIVASINYRLGPFGFLYFDHEDAPGNAAQFDQRLALKWLYNNIEIFGGNRHKIALFGESSGAVSINLHLLSPESWPYFNNVILQSGAFGAHWAFQTKEVALERAYKLAELVDCKEQDVKDSIACLQKVAPDKLALQQWYVGYNHYYFDITFGPTVDGVFLADYPDVLTKKKAFKHTNVLAGVNTNEGTYFLIYGLPGLFPARNESVPKVSYDVFSKSIGTVLESIANTDTVRETVINEYYTSILPKKRLSLHDVIGEVAGDVWFKCPTIEFTRLYTMSNDKVYLYHYGHRSSFNPWPRYAGVMHGYEIDLVFGQPLNSTFSYSQDEVSLSRQMMKFWTNFAKTGNPNKELSTSQGPEKWLPFTNYSQHFYVLNATGSKTLSGLKHRECSLINSLLPKLVLAKSEGKTKAGPCVSKATHRTRPASLANIIRLAVTVIFSTSLRNVWCSC